jgi:hypothetical protein
MPLQSISIALILRSIFSPSSTSDTSLIYVDGSKPNLKSGELDDNNDKGQDDGLNNGNR